MQDITNLEFCLIRDYIRDNYGISLGDEKKSLIYSRLNTVLKKHNFSDFSQYYDYLVSDKTGKAASTFIDKMTTNHTYFMREAEHFDYFKRTVLPYLEKTVKDRDLRVWCAGCSSGEEAYAIEMLLMDYFKDKPGWDTELLATDISSTVLEKAAKGIYSEEQIAPVDPLWKGLYFKRYDKNNFIVTDEIKNKITFRRHNLMEAGYRFKKKFHCIFCRNVMIYFDNEIRTELASKFYYVSEKGAYLFIGLSESLNNIKVDYSYVHPAVYRKE